MASGDQHDWTVLVLGRPGDTARRYRVSRRLFGLFLIFIVCVGFAIGYVLARRDAARAPVAAASVTQEPDPSAAPAQPIDPAPAVAPTTLDAGAAEPTPAAAEPAAAAPTAPTAPAGTAVPADGEPLRILRENGSELIELHPFAADGSANASAFELLETEMACGSGHRQKPEPSLVRVLLEIHQHFGKPLLLLGGRCAAHDDQHDSLAQHRAGRAADVRVRGVSSEQLTTWLVEHGVGGVGRFKRASYVHVDVRSGPREEWEAVEPAPEKPRPKPEPAPSAAPEPAAEPAPAPAAPAEATAPEPAAE